MATGDTYEQTMVRAYFQSLRRVSQLNNELRMERRNLRHAEQELESIGVIVREYITWTE